MIEKIYSRQRRNGTMPVGRGQDREITSSSLTFTGKLNQSEYAGYLFESEHQSEMIGAFLMSGNRRRDVRCTR